MPRKNVGVTLRQSGLIIEFHADHFADDADDATWISAVGQRGWVVLTKDKTIRTRPVELQALEAAKVRMLRRAGEGIRTPDVQLGKLAFYH